LGLQRAQSDSGFCECVEALLGACLRVPEHLNVLKQIVIITGIQPSAVRPQILIRLWTDPGGVLFAGVPAMPTAVFVDAGFFLKRFSIVYPSKSAKDPAVVARTLHEMCLGHLAQRGSIERRDLYRIFVYDCPPLSKKAHLPISKAPIDFGKSSTAEFRLDFHRALKGLRKVALRLGRLQDRRTWRLKPGKTSELLSGSVRFESLTDADFIYDVNQKGTDMKIGLDIASISYKKQVDQIVLVAGDADFVPAAKLARREGVDFILDPMWNNVPDDLHEHVDGLRSTAPRPDSQIGEGSANTVSSN
jgi:uncharacterized LabA/DUF88 family protein